MRRILSALFGLDLDDELSIWVEEEELGKEKILLHRKKDYKVKIPERIDRQASLRLRGLGRTWGNKRGDLLLHVWLNKKGEDVRRDLWLSEASARQGTNKLLLLGERKVRVVIPPKSHHGLVIRLKGLGALPASTRLDTPRVRRRGNLLVRLCVYPDSVTPQYGSFESLSTDDMALEGWVYRKIDEVFGKMGRLAFVAGPMQAGAVADAFNMRGWRGPFDALIRHLGLTRLDIQLLTSNSLPQPGNCQRTVNMQDKTLVGSQYVIAIHGQFLDNPFAIAAIVAHELCHVAYAEWIDEAPKPAAQATPSARDTLEAERTVDLLVFLFKLGEFQLRVARDKRLTLGYFDQGMFERIQVIASRKLGSL